MAFVENIIIPIFQLAVYIFLLGGLLFMINWILKKSFPYIKYTIKYRIFRKPFKEKDVEWCYMALEKNMNETDIKKRMLLKGHSMKRIEEITYIYKRIKKEMKGGGKNGR